MGFSKRIGLNKFCVIAAACVMMFVMTSIDAYAGADTFYGYTVPETYREDGSRFGSFRYEGYPIYVQKLGENGEPTGSSQVVYCFNLTKAAPTSKHVSAAERVFYEREIGTCDNFRMYADNKKLGDSAEKDTLNVLFKGFPQNGTGIMDKYNLDEEEFRYVTQCAVWFYTDDGPTELSTGSDDMKAAYREMIRSENKNLAKETLGVDMTLEIFASDNPRYQHLIGTSFKTPDDILTEKNGGTVDEETPGEDQPGDVVKEENPDEDQPDDEVVEEDTPDDDQPGEEVVEEETPSEEPATEDKTVESNDKADGIVVTGDETNLMVYALLMAAAVAGVAGLLIARKN